MPWVRMCNLSVLKEGKGKQRDATTIYVLRNDAETVFLMMNECLGHDDR